MRCNCYNNHNSASGRCHHTVDNGVDYCTDCVRECGRVNPLYCHECGHLASEHAPVCGFEVLKDGQLAACCCSAEFTKVILELPADAMQRLRDGYEVKDPALMGILESLKVVSLNFSGRPTCAICTHPIDAHTPECSYTVGENEESCPCVRHHTQTDVCPACSNGMQNGSVCPICRGSRQVRIQGVVYSFYEYGICPNCNHSAFLKNGVYCYACDAGMGAMMRAYDGEE